MERTQSQMHADRSSLGNPMSLFQKVDDESTSCSACTDPKFGWKILVTAFATMTSCPNIHIEAVSTWTPLTECISSQYPQDRSESPYKKIIENFRNIFGVTISDLAIILGVTRPTIYSYLRGHQQPNADLALGMEKLREYVQSATQIKINNLNYYTKRPLFLGKSLFDLMVKKKYSIDEQLIVIKSIHEEEYKIGKFVANSLASKRIHSDDVSPSPVLYKE